MAHVLRQLEPFTHPDLLVGTDTLDDAGVFRLDAETALVQTTDFFPPLVDDPYEFGRIAAANALSDVYAMGGEPLTALNLVGFPDDQLGPEVLVAILKGGAERVRAAGAVILGGHSVRDAEIKYGLAVTGRVHPDKILTNAGAKPGDKLVLTKPIGSGVLTSAVKLGKLPEAELSETIHVMTSLNKPGRDAALIVGVNACTDITGFGLVGHAFEVAEASDVTLVIEASKVPLLERTLEFARKGTLTRAWKSTRSHLGAKLALDGVDEVLANVLMDAQTSGGLFLSVPPDRCDLLVSELATAGALCSSVIGSVEPAGSARVCLRA
jgi:selenide,water dikinase